ncbi:MAG: methyltransferase domain-containing protein [Pseudomonadota bacterium]
MNHVNFPPSMVSDHDVALVESIAQKFNPEDIVLEFGPWLGRLSIVLAEHMELHSVDRFCWTEDHAKRVPDAINPGESFIHLFEENLAQRGLSATNHVVDFSEFEWGRGPISLIVIDAPKSAETLFPCLASSLPYLQQGGRIILKNALAPARVDLIRYLSHLVEAGIVTLPEQVIERNSNVLVMAPGNGASLIAPNATDTPNDDAISYLLNQLPLSDDHPVHFSGVTSAILSNDIQAAYIALSNMKPSRPLAKSWSKLELQLAKKATEEAAFSTFCEMVMFHHTHKKKDGGPQHFAKSAALAMRGFWANNDKNDWRGASFCPSILTKAFEYGYMSWPNKVRLDVAGKDILDIGCGPGLHGIGYLAAGARSYLGLDPIVKPDKDRVKNLMAKNKMPFGWTPNELSALIPPWHVSPIPIEELELERDFDLATLHNVTEHLHKLDDVFRETAARLKPGGQILYNHHNFYSWNGHHLPPKAVGHIDLDDPSQREMIDWGHVDYEPAPDHYIARGLNRVRLDEVIEITNRYFRIEYAEETPVSPQNGGLRLTDDIRNRYPHLDDRDFLTQNLLCVATVIT